MSTAISLSELIPIGDERFVRICWTTNEAFLIEKINDPVTERELGHAGEWCSSVIVTPEHWTAEDLNRVQDWDTAIETYGLDCIDVATSPESAIQERTY